MVLFSVGLLLGICAVLGLPELPAAMPLAVAVGGGAAGAAVLRSRALAALTLGVLVCWLEGRAQLGERLDPALEGRTVGFVGHVASVPLEREGGAVRLRVDVEGGGPQRLPSRVELSWYEPEWRPRPGERLEVEARLRRPRGFANPGGSDLEARLLREGIGATGYVRSASRLGRTARDVARYPALVARDAIARAIDRALGERPATGIVQGLAVGLQDALSREQWQALSRSGTSHLMAISGLHIGMLAVLAAWLAGRVQRWRLRHGARMAARDVAVIAGVAATLGYSALAGWSVPTQRTALMICVAAWALRARRRPAASDVLALTAVLLLLASPLDALAPGFWLSFGAVAVILAATGGFLRREHWFGSYLRVQFAVTFGLAPVLIGSFGGLSLVSALVNLVAIPLYTLLVVPAVLLGSALALAWPAAGAVALRLVAALIESTWPLIEQPAAWDASVWYVASLPPLAWAALFVGVAVVLSPLAASARAAGLLLVVAACAWRPAAPQPQGVRLVLLDVGQGLAVVIQTQRHALLYDTGPGFRSGSDAGLLAVVPYLRHAGVRRLDLLVVSHDDLDHTGGVQSVLASVPTRAIVTGGVPALEDRAGACSPGSGWTWDGVEFRWLHPAPEARDGRNDASCVLLVEAAGRRLLLPGDLEAEGERALLERGLPGPVDVVVVPHHGSRTSSTPALVERLRPRWALVPAGHGNRWGFPNPQIVSRWRATGAEVLGTAGSGAIEFEVAADGRLGEPRQYRLARRRWWRDA